MYCPKKFFINWLYLIIKMIWIVLAIWLTFLKHARIFSFNHFGNYYHRPPTLNKDEKGENNKKEEEIKNYNKNAYKIVVHQLENNEEFEIPLTGEKVQISFPLQILVYKNDGSINGLINGDAFILHDQMRYNKNFLKIILK